MTGGLDSTVRLWEAGSGKEYETLRGHAHYVWSLSFSPEGKALAVGSGFWSCSQDRRDEGEHPGPVPTVGRRVVAKLNFHLHPRRTF
jgi:hypothetical protein